MDKSLFTEKRQQHKRSHQYKNKYKQNDSLLTADAISPGDYSSVPELRMRYLIFWKYTYDTRTLRSLA